MSRIALLRNLPEYREVPRNNRLREHLQLAASTRIVLYQGNIQPNRELDRLIHAASHFEPGIVLVIMGKDMKGTVSQLHSLIEQQGVAGQVKILPPVPYSELLTWTASADLGVTIYSPDYSLNVSMFLPNKLFEYLLVGVPVLSSNIGPIVEVIQKYDVGQIIASLAPEDIAAAINLLLHDKEALQRMRAHALTASRDELCWEKESPRLLQLYAEIAHKEC
ncbi:glycosyltransferase [Dictyobacter kobayashii]|uniref:glycosyltransferase n=1 Tax=Dictyobacter kobayashii TaxID=2014872 RepID=UPI002482AD7F|nr:glycosyltransferase [Dictyobacter kobayashii]